MASFSYKQKKTTTLKACGFIDIDSMTITVDEEEKSLKTLLSDFNGGFVELVVKVKEEQELNEPVSSEI